MLAVAQLAVRLQILDGRVLLREVPPGLLQDRHLGVERRARGPGDVPQAGVAGVSRRVVTAAVAGHALLRLVAKTVQQPSAVVGELGVDHHRQVPPARRPRRPIPERFVGQPVGKVASFVAAPDHEARLVAAFRKIELRQQIVIAPLDSLRMLERPVIKPERVFVPGIEIHRDFAARGQLRSGQFPLQRGQRPAQALRRRTGEDVHRLPIAESRDDALPRRLVYRHLDLSDRPGVVFDSTQQV